MEILFRGIEPDSEPCASELSLIVALQIVSEDDITLIHVSQRPAYLSYNGVIGVYTYRKGDCVRVKAVVGSVNEWMNGHVRLITVSHEATHFVIDVPNVLVIHLVLTHYAVGSYIFPHVL